MNLNSIELVVVSYIKRNTFYKEKSDNSLDVFYIHIESTGRSTAILFIDLSDKHVSDFHKKNLFTKEIHPCLT